MSTCLIEGICACNGGRRCRRRNARGGGSRSAGWCTGRIFQVVVGNELLHQLLQLVELDLQKMKWLN
jgi:hypothetical protein